jgi:hypothetical protein
MDKIDYYISQPTTGNYLYKCMNGKCNVIAYSDLQKYNNIDNVLKNGCAFILVETSQNTGHWIALIKIGNNKIEVFNSYGGFIDYYLYYVPENMREILGENYPHLTALLLKSKYEIHYNNYPLQIENDNVATCGRHCIVRALNKNMDIDEYFEWMNNLKFSPDEAVTILTLGILKGS